MLLLIKPEYGFPWQRMLTRAARCLIAFPPDARCTVIKVISQNIRSYYTAAGRWSIRSCLVPTSLGGAVAK